MKALVTGAAGLVGRAAVSAFEQRGWEVVGVSRNAAEALPGVPWITAELADDELPREAFEGVTAVVHLAAIPGPGVVSDARLFRNNVCATFNVLHAAAEAGVRRAVVASSISIYGLVYAAAETDPPEIPLRETSELRVSDAYALGKETDDATARMIARRYGMSIASLRLPNISSETVVRERMTEAHASADHAHRELWAYLTTEDAGEAVALAATAEFEGLVIANCVSPSSLVPNGFADAARQFYPARDATGIECGYTTDVARDVFGFEGRIVVD